MQSHLPVPTLSYEGQKSRHQHKPKTEFYWQRSLVSPLHNPTMAFRRHMLVSVLFKHTEEIQSIDGGYAFRFHWSDDLDDLIGQIANYIVFESRNSPQLRFAIVEEPRAEAFWLQVQSTEGEKHDIASASVSSDSFGSSLI
jgi:hypothetical protein